MKPVICFRRLSVAATVLLMACHFSVAQEIPAPSKRQIAEAEKRLRADGVPRLEARQIVQRLSAALEPPSDPGAIVRAAREIAVQRPDNHEGVASAAATLAPWDAVMIAKAIVALQPTVLGVYGEGVVERILEDPKDRTWVISLSGHAGLVLVVERSAQRRLKRPHELAGKTIRFDGLTTTYRGLEAVRISQAERLKIVE